MKKALFILTACLASTASLFSVDISFDGMVGAAASIHDAQAVGTHDPSTAATSYTTVGSFQVDCAYLAGFTITAQLAGTGWSHYGTGTTQGTDFNVFTGFRLHSTDSGNYNGANAMAGILPTWGTVDTSAQTMSNGTQSAKITNWEVLAQAQWDAEASLNAGAYTQTLSVTIAEGT